MAKKGMSYSRDILSGLFKTQINGLFIRLSSEDNPISLEEIIAGVDFPPHIIKQDIKYMVSMDWIAAVPKDQGYYFALSENGRDFLSHLLGDELRKYFSYSISDKLPYYEVLILLAIYKGVRDSVQIRDELSINVKNTIQLSLCNLIEKGLVASAEKKQGPRGTKRKYLTEEGKRVASAIYRSVVYLDLMKPDFSPVPDNLFLRRPLGTVKDTRKKENENTPVPRRKSHRHVRYIRQSLSSQSHENSPELESKLSNAPVVGGKTLRRVTKEAWLDDASHTGKEYIASLLKNLAASKPAEISGGSYFACVKNARQNKMEYSGCNTFVIGRVLPDGKALVHLEITRFPIHDEEGLMNALMIFEKNESVKYICSSLGERYSSSKMVPLDEQAYQNLAYILSKPHAQQGDAK